MTRKPVIKLGQEVRDTLTGFQGIAYCRTIYLQGCNRVGIVPRVRKDGTLPDQQHFDEPELEIVGDGVLSTTSPKHIAKRTVKRSTRGGPHGFSFAVR